MRSAREEFRLLVDSFEPRSREYWRQVAATLLGWVPQDAGVTSNHAMAVVRFISATLGVVFREVIPIASSLRFDYCLQPAIDHAKTSYDIPDHALPCMELAKEELKDSLKLERDRHERFVRKAQAYLMGVAVGVSFAIGMLGLLAKGGALLETARGMSLLIKALLIAVVLSLFMAAIAALWVIAPSEAWDLWLQERRSESDPEFEKRQVLKLALLNQGLNLISANHLSTSYTGMRNGMFLILFLLVWTIIVT